jgi:hypothetical protein
MKPLRKTNKVFRFRNHTSRCWISHISSWLRVSVKDSYTLIPLYSCFDPPIFSRGLDNVIRVRLWAWVHEQ